MAMDIGLTSEDLMNGNTKKLSKYNDSGRSWYVVSWQ